MGCQVAHCRALSEQLGICYLACTLAVLFYFLSTPGLEQRTLHLVASTDWVTTAPLKWTLLLRFLIVNQKQSNKVEMFSSLMHPSLCELFPFGGGFRLYLPLVERHRSQFSLVVVQSDAPPDFIYMQSEISLCKGHSLSFKWGCTDEALSAITRLLHKAFWTGMIAMGEARSVGESRSGGGDWLMSWAIRAWKGVDF